MLPVGIQEWEDCSDADRWQAAIREAVETPDPVLSNLRITRVHFLLGRALQKRLGPETGANFHAWAVWGSRKAGVTVRQEDLDSAIQNADRVAGIVGAAVGGVAAEGARRQVREPIARSRLPLGSVGIAAGVLLGRACGAAVGRAIAVYSRGAASRLILAGNRTVLEDIGTLSAHFLAATVPSSRKSANDHWEAFLGRFRSGPTARSGQDLLRNAFILYRHALLTDDPAEARTAAYRANCLAVLHEHVRLEPYIRGSMPWIIRHCVTERMMTFDVGGLRLSVGKDVPTGKGALLPPVPTTADVDCDEWTKTVSAFGKLRIDGNTRAEDWTDIRQRMRFVFELFRIYHSAPTVFAAPYTESQLTRIAQGNIPDGPL